MILNLAILNIRSVYNQKITLYRQHALDTGVQKMCSFMFLNVFKCAETNPDGILSKKYSSFYFFVLYSEIITMY